MHPLFALLLLIPIMQGCSSDIIEGNTSKTKNFFQKSLVFTKPENEYLDRRILQSNVTTLQNAKQKRQRQQLSYDPYYPQTKPWNEKPQPTNLFPTQQY